VAEFLIDEDLPRSLSLALAAADLQSIDVRDVGLRGKSDDEVYKYAQSRQLTIVTGDLGFGNVLRYPLGEHSGIVVARLPNEMSVSAVNEIVAKALVVLSESDLLGNVVIVEVDRIRLRSKGGESTG
jgi:predicted nuclease of predicted toxin-antitoxin system